MGALKDLWKSERGLIMVALIAAVTTLCGLGLITETQWLDYTKWIFVTYVAGKTVSGSVAMVTASPDDAPSWEDKLKSLVELARAYEGRVRATTDSPPPTATTPPTPPPAAQGATQV
jgi:hypothetical protein